ncbi:hypothetical protein BD311DRAFT_790578 [Dichomitus squalens]|uniref:Phospholipid/glycerol acyltransferase domain-containing protein n=1 Tax=Dichomitus squalens TaxID=114155 RepID=A0A4Q9MCZ7_9APHY|nr:hypothetical protein BD311DRAFT_790578 [Dichomitus squalens]
MAALAGSPTPWAYMFIRLLFKFVLKIFYGTIVVENVDNIPPRGVPCIVCANHSNSLTDALLLVTSIPSRKRNLLRLTAKSTQFGRKTFTSWLIESAGTVPIKRRKDFGDQQVDNSNAMQFLVEAVELGDAVCLFPEGMSRYHPTIAPLKTGVARMVSDVLSRNRHNPDFEIDVLTCSITYMHREHFRSDVLVTFHPPMKFTPKVPPTRLTNDRVLTPKTQNNPELLTPIDYNEIRSLTAKMHQQISSGTLDAPSWRLIRNAKLAARMYAPLGTSMSLGDYIRVVRTFLEAFKLAEAPRADASSDGEAPPPEQVAREDMKIVQLGRDLKEYQDQLARWGIKDDRIRRPLSRPVILYRVLLRSIAPYKLTYGFLSRLCIWLLATLCFAPLTAVLVPAVMWLSLRWMEDAIAAFRALASLTRLLLIGKPALAQMRSRREDLHRRVMELAVSTLGLPGEPERYFAESGGREKGRVQGRWASKAKYFSVRRRRKRDWNETLRLYDQVDYPGD